MVQKRVCTSSEAMVNYHARHLASGDYHLEESKVQGEFLGTLAQDRESLRGADIYVDEADL
jgi:hypothetical protein